jgi:hypothetical protein
MALEFTIDPATGVWKPPVTVFNGGKRKSKKTRKVKKSRKATRKVLRRRR